MPVEYSKPLDFALPINGTVPPESTCAVPLELVAVSCNFIDLNASESPETKPTSGVP